MERKKTIVTEHINEGGINVLEASDIIEVINFDGKASKEEIDNAVPDASAILVRSEPVTREMIESAPKLEIIAKHGVGYDNIDVAAATEKKIPVTITPEANSDSVAELAILMMLALARKIISADMDLKAGQFEKREDYIGFELGGKTLGIIGIGRIGSRVSRRMSSGFSMKVLAYDPFVSTEYVEQFGAEHVDELNTLLELSDVVTIHTPLTELTENMISEPQLRLMKDDAIIINAARAGIINEKALFHALTENWIKGAGLDVFSIEPPHPDDSPLLSLSNIIVTPHLGSGAIESLFKMATHAAEDIVRVLNGEHPKDPINPEIYD